MKLPSMFLEANVDGVKGGVEFGFMSTTADKNVALQYSRGAAGVPRTLFTARTSLTSRGAYLGFLSQCAAPPPLAALPLCRAPPSPPPTPFALRAPPIPREPCSCPLAFRATRFEHVAERLPVSLYSRFMSTCRRLPMVLLCSHFSLTHYSTHNLFVLPTCTPHTRPPGNRLLT